jgi:hypothetical protein
MSFAPAQDGTEEETIESDSAWVSMALRLERCCMA